MSQHRATTTPPMKKPELHDFGITPEEYEHHRLKNRTISHFAPFLSILVVCSALLMAGVITFYVVRSVEGSFVGGAAGLFLVVCLFVLCFRLAMRIRRVSISENRINIRIKRFKDARAAYLENQLAIGRARLEAQRKAERARQAAERERQAAERAEGRKRIDYWRSLRDIQFERELAALYRHSGYQVQFTPKSGDDGVDLILTKDGRSTIVQCKGQKDRATPKMVRELLGSRVDHGADLAVLACTSGFTQGAIRFAKRNEIALISATEIARMAVGYSQPQQEQALMLKNPVPKESASRECPKCGREMTLQSTKYDRFWRCSRFPNCKSIQRS